MEKKPDLSERQLQMLEFVARAPYEFYIADHFYHGIWDIPFLGRQRTTPIVAQIRSTVSRSMKKLGNEGLITQDKPRTYHLTNAGRKYFSDLAKEPPEA